MIEPLTSLAFAVQSGKGVYALLLGSGVSYSSGIPTGWKILVDLIRAVCELQKEDCGDKPEVWYERKYGKAPDYSDLFEELRYTGDERQQFMRRYFEPTEEERENNKKQPTEAHRAIAKLVARGYFRVIVTTNFDRLMENALKDEGVEPSVISSVDGIKGAAPLAHSMCTIIKVHGDYLDHRFRNTYGELATYDPEMDRFLDRVFDEYGLIVCGWSAEWDEALRKAILRCPTRRYSTYWASHEGKVCGKAQHLCGERRAQNIAIKGADDFFSSLLAKVESIEETDSTHPLVKAVASATAKRYLARPEFNIKLFDMVRQETERVYRTVFGDQSPANEYGPSLCPEDEASLIRRFESAAEILQTYIIAGCYWGGPEYDRYWARAIEHLANPPDAFGVYEMLPVRLYTAYMLLYSGGIAAVASENYRALAAMFNQMKFRMPTRSVNLAYYLHPEIVISNFKETIARLQGGTRYPMPLSRYFHTRLREPLREYLSSDHTYDEIFDKFEYLYAIAWAEGDLERARRTWAPIGLFGFHYSEAHPGDKIMDVIDRESIPLGSNWPPLVAGLFGGQDSSFFLARERFDKFAKAEMRKRPFG